MGMATAQLSWECSLGAGNLLFRTLILMLWVQDVVQLALKLAGRVLSILSWIDEKYACPEAYSAQSGTYLLLLLQADLWCQEFSSWGNVGRSTTAQS